jgi:hypothetical protein
MMFGAIWIGDSIFLPSVALGQPVLFMRVVSALLYPLYLGLAYAMVIRKQIGRMTLLARYRQIRPFLIHTGVFGFVTFLIGAFLVLLQTPIAGVGFVLTKFIGAPLSIAIAYLFGSPGRTYTMKSVALGVVLAFMIFAFACLVEGLGVLGDWSTFAICAIMFGLCLWLIDAELSSIGKLLTTYDEYHTPDEIIRRPVRSVISAPSSWGWRS